MDETPEEHVSIERASERSRTMSGSNKSKQEELSVSRTVSEIWEVESRGGCMIGGGMDLIGAARRNIRLMRGVSECELVHQRPTLLEALRRYEELWMPLISDLTELESWAPPMVLPPFDVEWVWFCHSLNPDYYKKYCEMRFSKLIGKPQIFDQENEEYALMRCKKLWTNRYPTEAFDNEVTDSDLQDPVVNINKELLDEVQKHRYLYSSKFSWPYMGEIVYLIAARQRYKWFLYLLHTFADGCSRLVPSLDILLMWISHQSYPTVYAEGMKEMETDMGKVVGLSDIAKEKEVEETKKLWERVFDQPFEIAGGAIALEGIDSVKPPMSWEVSEIDVNTKYKSLMPRFLLEVCTFVKLNSSVKSMQDEVERKFLRLRVVRLHREMKIDQMISNFVSGSWRKGSHLYCEFGDKGLIIELRMHGGGCFKRSKLTCSVTFMWNDLLRAPSLTLEREIGKQVRVIASITPPVQAPYLLKCVPDRVTDDSGAMISDVILRMNHYKPQEGRWLSRTVLDHAGRECFVVRMRVGGGFWRRGGETPSAVKWEDRIVEIREGSWSYVAGSIGRAPEKIVGTATPKEPPANFQAAWHFSTGDELLITWESLASNCDLSLTLRNHTSSASSVKLFKGCKMQYATKKTSFACKEKETPNEEGRAADEEGFVTLVRLTEDNPSGRATALINWKLLIVEFMPDEDAVLVLLLCISILRSVSEMRKEDVGRLLIRRRQKEPKFGLRDWGSVIIHPSSHSLSVSSPHLQPWYWNPNALIASQGVDNANKQPVLNDSQVEGGDKLYKQGIIT